MTTSTPPTATQTQPLFREVQRFRQRWLWVLLGGTGGATGLSMAAPLYERIIRSEKGWQDALAQHTGLLTSAGLGLATLASVAGLVAAAKLVVEVHHEGMHQRHDLRPPQGPGSGAVHVRFRGLFVNREIPLAEIEHAEAVTYSPMKDYGGWGLRYGPGGKAYNVSGDRGVRLTFTDGDTLLIGSQRAEALAAAIHQAQAGGA